MEFRANAALFFTPNPCIERTLRVADFARGQSHRVHCDDLRVTAGGKGINAARVATRFGAHVSVLTPVGRNQSAQFRALLRADNLNFDLVETEADTRTTINVVHCDGFTELVEAGRALGSADLDALTERFGTHLKSCEIAVIGGSYPPGAGENWENHGADLCEMAARAGKRVFYDGKGAQFARALRSAHPPWAIKPNLDEARELLNRDLPTPDSQRNAAREMTQMGVEIVLLSCGARGLWLGYNGKIQWLAAPKVEEVSPVGSGDSLVGAFVAKWLQSGDIYESARWGVAAGAANATQLEAAQIGPSDAQVLLR